MSNSTSDIFVKRSRLALGGLLHDIGKFAQRAGEQVSAEWSENKTQADFKYQHALHTWHFVQKYVPSDFQANLLAAYHHAPQNAAQRLIRLADQLSSGERDSGENRDDSDRKSHPRQLHPIFTQVETHEGKHPFHGQNKFYFPLKPLALQKDIIFPKEDPLPDTEVWPAYDEMWEAFCKEAENLQALPLEAYLEAMQALMHRYTWSIPSAYFGSVPDVSLYDHSRMTAALAVCLSDFDDDTIQALNRDWQAKGGEMWEKPVALLVGGDISGVQKFIYTISSKGAAKALRGRSFYLQLLTEAVLRFVLRELDLPYTNVIYSGGGNFYLLAPLSAQVHLPKIQARIAQTLWPYHATDLYLVLGWATAPLGGFRQGQFPQYWRQMHADIQQRKVRRYLELGDALYETVFAPLEHGGNPEAVCSVCGSEMRTVECWDEWEGQERICTLCRSFVEQLGTPLPRAKGLRWQWVTPARPRQHANITFHDVLRAFGVQVEVLTDWPTEPADAFWLFDDPPETRTWPAAPAWLRYVLTQIPAVRDAEEAQTINDRLPAAEREEEPAKPGHPKTFTHLQVQPQGGFQRLGVLRMDVDNLGSIFQRGLGDLATLSRLAALSFQMSLFFEGWVKRIIAEDEWAHLIYAVYAGGDDLFLVGPWDQMPDLALRIVEDFAAYTGHHPALHLSGGMAFIHGKYPIYQAAEDAGDAEDQAKAAGRNRFTFLGRVWTWEEFGGLLKAHKDKLVALVEASQNKAVLRVLQNLAVMAEAIQQQYREDQPSRMVWRRWQWLAAYQLSRMAANENNPERRAQYLAIREGLTDFAHLQHWAYAARWAQLEIRG